MDDRTSLRARLEALAEPLRVHGFTVELTVRGLVVKSPQVGVCCPGAEACCSQAGQPGLADTITCRPNADDGGRPWFFTSWQKPIAPADQITDAVVAVKGYLSGGRP